MPPADRVTLRRFRRLVAEQGADVYVALSDDQAVGFIHVTYARQLAGAARARIEALVVRGPQAQAAGRLLLDLAVRRARKRGCAGFYWLPAGSCDAAHGVIDAGGWRSAGDVLYFDLLDAQGSGDG
jgi:GNAT superfamily N-acetyltransferase